MEKIAVIDFGGQYAHLIAARIRSLGVFSEIHQPEEFFPDRISDLAGIVFSGGPHSVTDSEFPTVGFDVRLSPVPILGLCYGHQLLAKLAGGNVVRGMNREYGPVEIAVNPGSRLFSGLPARQTVWMSHGDHVENLPREFRISASSEKLIVAAFESADGKIFGLQFHPEVSHTEFGSPILTRFLSICTRQNNWNPGNFRDLIIEKTKETADGKKLFLLLSGGVDSLVALKVCLEAVGPGRVSSIHIDTGLMRLNESAEIISHLEKTGFTGIRLINAETRFLKALSGIYDPEQKRKIIGKLFVEVLQESIPAGFSDGDWLLVQGTIYPDTIESGSTKKAAKIKTHHNRVEEIERLIMRGKVIEPLKDLYKDEVRKLGAELGLPDFLINRHPFPGPGLGIRILASDSDIPESGFERELPELSKIAGEYGFEAAILPVKSVGVQGDSRSYLHPAAIWNPRPKPIDWRALRDIAMKIVNGFKTVNRVVFSFSSLEKRLKLFKADVNKRRADLLRKVDSVVRAATSSFGEIWQMPVISLPAVDENGKEVFVLRPVTSINTMTADFFEMPANDLEKLIENLMKIDSVGKILYDITPKPPGTIEWE